MVFLEKTKVLGGRIKIWKALMNNLTISWYRKKKIIFMA